MFLSLLSYAGIVLGFVLLTLSIASGLFYISELVEEQSAPTKKFLTRSIYTIIGIYVLLWLFDGFPFWLTLFSIVTYVIYLQNLKHFPLIQLKSPVFIASCILVVVNHYLWFQHFSNPKIPAPQYRLDPNYKAPRIASFSEVASFFGICIWFIPFGLFVSLSASDNILPTASANFNSGNFDDISGKSKRGKTQGLAKVVVGTVRDWIYSVARAFGYELDPDHGRIV
ncbi:putative membrane protein [Wickerhamomyces ciferrii]|uniref:Membrane protein n=1 Tax=Wickerhamomyces ciferrii (strain ATCC 14091 / BCRC 22168 / CBS 111 / JCM 3599 / NBRC 0793 / NRRL Y-1031 F-60-10) TaxID=1206466 RepID=K0K7T0_WICCF|nr:uncharacterized protein BN7_404 [Wickerhamomyces ciferrii]CCH40870.1 putative membrane protein [Wickerhamomyces ciferrii]